jgi:hypothetical protein
MRRPAHRTRRTLGTGLVAGSLLLAPAAHATAPLPSAPTGALHLGKKALDLIGKMALELVPPHFDVPNVTKDLLSCSSGLEVMGAYADIVPKSLTFMPADGSLTVAAQLDLTGYAHVNIHFGTSCFSALSCDVGFAAQGLAPTAAVQLSITDGKPKAGLGTLTAMTAPGGLKLDIQNCALQIIPQSVVDALGQKLLESVNGPLGDQLRTMVPPMVEQQLGSMLGKSGTVAGYGFNAAITDLKMTAEGIDAYAEIGVDYEGQPAACLPPDAGAPAAAPRNPTPAGAGTMSLPQGPTSSIVVGVSTDLVSSALNAAWTEGMLCTDDSQIAKLGFDPSQLAKLVPGLPPGLTMHFTMGMDTPPTVDTDKNGALHMHVKGAELLLSMSSPGEPTSGVAVATDFSVAVAPSVDPVSGSVYADLTDMTMERMEVHAGLTSTTYTLDPERLAVLMHDVVLPMASAKLKGMPLSPAAFGMNGVYAWLTNLSAQNGAVYVGAEAFRPGPASDDHELPTTSFQKLPGKLVRAGMARFTVAGLDDTTPPELLRFEWQVDDQPLQPLSFARGISAPVTTAGTHTFRVRAVDLYDKAAAEFQAYTFELDPVAPTLQILEQPDVALRATSTTIKLTGSDDRTPTNLLSFAYRVEARPPGGEATLVASGQPTGLDGGVGEIHIDDLKDGTTYDVTVLLYDEAGNVTSQKVGFGVASSSGCSLATRGASAGSAAWVLLLAVLAFAARRRSIPR